MADRQSYPVLSPPSKPPTPKNITQPTAATMINMIFTQKLFEKRQTCFYSGLNLNQDKATKPQTVQIVRQGEATLYWFKVKPLYHLIQRS